MHQSLSVASLQLVIGLWDKITIVLCPPFYWDIWWNLQLYMLLSLAELLCCVLMDWLETWLHFFFSFTVYETVRVCTTASLSKQTVSIYQSDNASWHILILTIDRNFTPYLWLTWVNNYFPLLTWIKWMKITLYNIMEI